MFGALFNVFQDELVHGVYFDKVSCESPVGISRERCSHGPYLEGNIWEAISITIILSGYGQQNPTHPRHHPSNAQSAFKFTPPSGKTLQSASVLMIADNACASYGNGQLIGESPDLNNDSLWNRELSQRFKVPLRGISAVFAVNATNSPDMQTGGGNPAGLLATICITFTDGSSETIVSDTTWEVFDPTPVRFQHPFFDDSS